MDPQTIYVSIDEAVKGVIDLPLFLGLVKNEEGRAKSPSSNLLYDFIVFHLSGLGVPVLCLHRKFQKVEDKG